MSVSQNSTSHAPSVSNDNDSSRAEQFSGVEDAGVLERALRSDVVQLCPKDSVFSSVVRRFQAQRDFMCPRVDSALVRSWPEPSLGRTTWQKVAAGVQTSSGTALHESFCTSRHGGLSSGSAAGDFRKLSSRVETPRPTPPKGVHSEMYSTAFALHSLGDSSANCADYLTKVRTLWDSHLEGEGRGLAAAAAAASTGESCHADRVVSLPNVMSPRGLGLLSLSEGCNDLAPCVLLSHPGVTCSGVSGALLPALVLLRC